MQPLSSVGARLRELRTAQDQRKKQLLVVQAREHGVLKKLSGDHTSTPGAYNTHTCTHMHTHTYTTHTYNTHTYI